jgi:hypothetical protein
VVAVFCASLVSGSNSGLARLLSNFISPLGYVAFVACVAVAVLRYRLYEIDRIISRTLAYAIVTGLLVGFYAGLVLLTTQVFRVHTPAPWPPPRWPSPRCSTRCGDGCSGSWTGGSTAPARCRPDRGRLRGPG